MMEGNHSSSTLAGGRLDIIERERERERRNTGKEPKWRESELFLMVLTKGDSQAGPCNCRPPAPLVTSVKQGAGEVHRPEPPTQCCNAVYPLLRLTKPGTRGRERDPGLTELKPSISKMINLTRK